MNPEDFFKQTFGGDRFVDYIGEISIARDFGDALHGGGGGGGGGSVAATAGGGGDSNNNNNKNNSSSNMSRRDDGSSAAATVTLTDDDRDRIRQERIRRLAKNLVQKLSFYVDHPSVVRTVAASVPSSAECQAVLAEFERRIREEADDLKSASYGVELLQAIGFTYTLKARQWLGQEESFLGLGKWWNNVREKGHIFSETVGTIRAAVELQAALSRLQVDEEQQQRSKDELAGGAATATATAAGASSTSTTTATGSKIKPLTPEERALLEQQAALKGLNTLWKGSKMEVESVVRDVCDLLLSGQPLDAGDTAVPKEVVKRRADALKTIGRIFESVQPDPEHEKAKAHLFGGGR